MKKIVSIFAALTLLVSMLAFNVAAADADIQFSVTDAEATPGDTITVDVMVDENVGVWGMKFWITYDNRCFDLVSVTNGKVFKDSEAELSKNYDDSGEYMFYAESSGFENNTSTGVLVTLELKVLKAAPNGEHKIALDFSDRPHPTTPALDYKAEGFFFSADDYSPRTVEMTKAGIITVSGSVADPLPETTKAPEVTRAPEETKKPTQGTQSGNISGGYVTEIITEFVTDAEGEVVTNAEGEAVVTEVPIAVPEKNPISTDEETAEEKKEPVTEIVYVTDAEGEKVTEPDGEPVTEIVVIEDEGNNSMDTVILVICIIAIAAAVALITFVVISRKKANKEENN